jgi:hypothetical protein
MSDIFIILNKYIITIINMDTKIVSKNCIEYNATDPNHSYTITYNGSTMNSICGMVGDTWTYRPTDTNSQLFDGKKGVACIKRIAERLPKIDLPIRKDIDADYPTISSSAFNMIGVDYYYNREVIAIGGVVLFRRYNDDWNCTMICSSGTYSTTVISWKNSYSLTFLEQLEKLLQEKNIESITKTDMQILE